MPNPVRQDPSRTATERRRFMVDIGKRFRGLKRPIIDLVVNEDAFGIGSPTIRRQAGIVVMNDRWRFETDANKVREFQKWLKDLVDRGILEVGPNGDPDTPWTNTYIQSAYRKGLVRSYVQARPGLAAISAEFAAGSQAEFLIQAFASPEAVSKLQLLYSRTYSSLRGITEVMDRQLSDILATGLARGDNPRTVARNITRNIEKITRTRALMLARTEIIHAHAEGQLDSFERLGIEEVGVMAEWITAGDDRVCPQCGALSGAVFTVQEARGMLPRHPNCRCAWIPANVDGKTVVPTKQRIKSQLAQSIKAEGGRRRSLEESRQRSNWVGADREIGSRTQVRRKAQRENRRREEGQV